MLLPLIGDRLRYLLVFGGPILSVVGNSARESRDRFDNGWLIDVREILPQEDGAREIPLARCFFSVLAQISCGILYANDV